VILPCEARSAAGQGEAVGFEGETLHLVLDRPVAPGTPVAVRVGDLDLRGKSLGSKRRPDGRFDVRLRLVSLRREDRAKLEAAPR